MFYTMSVARQTQSTKSSESISENRGLGVSPAAGCAERCSRANFQDSVGSDGVLFVLMLAVVAGIFLFKGKKSITNTDTFIDSVTESKPIQPFYRIESEQDFGTSRFENGVNTSDLKSERPTSGTKHSTFNDQVGQRIIEELVSTKLSTLLAAPSGAGKSVTQAYWLSKLYEKFSQADVYVVARKNDSFNGLRELGKVFVYDTDKPKDSLQALQIVHDIFKVRSQFPEHEREQFKNSPVRLILADWYSIHNSLTKSHNKLWQLEVQTKLADIVTVAREFNVSLFADSQTFNLASLGLAEDSNIRNNLNIISQGLISIDEDGLEQGGFEVVQSIIRNPYIFPSEEVRRLFNLEVEKLIRLSNSQHIPLILSTAGKPKAGLLPNLIEYKGKNIFAPEEAGAKPNSPLNLPIHPKGETGYEVATDALSEPLRTIWRVAQEKQDWLSARDIAKKEYAVFKGRNTAAEIVAVVQKLERMGLLEINNEGQAIRFRVSHKKEYL
jgi:hypothetical protein